MDRKPDSQHIDLVDEALAGEDGKDQFTTTVNLTSGSTVYLVPTPSADPRDPLNLPKWRKILLLFCVSLYGTIGLSMVGGLASSVS
ncbi:hypothetical protein BJX65DRAFT_275589 [Aspergillus insuetus]